MVLKSILLVFLGGGFGSALRYLLSKLLNTSATIPYGTFVVNILGSLIIGLVLGWALKSNSISQNTVLFLATGFCGGFTTFSAFSFENYELLKAGDYTTFAIYAFGSLFLGILAIIAGVWLSKLF